MPVNRTTSNLVWRVFLPFACGVYLLLFFRNVNGLIAPCLIRDLHLSPAELGAMTAGFLLASGVSALPVGALLDRYGPRHVQAPLLLVASAGLLIFAAGEDYRILMLGRILIGVGLSAAMTGAVKAIVTWFRREQLPMVNGWMLACGSLGAVMASGPSDLLVQWIGWRHIFFALAGCTFMVSAASWLLVPEAPPTAKPSGSLKELRTILRDPNFLRIAPLAVSVVGSAWALQGLWAARWLAEVDGYSQAEVSNTLFVMACTLTAGALLLGSVGRWLGKRGVGIEAVFVGAALLCMVTQALILLRLPLSAPTLWGTVSMFASMTVLIFAVTSEFFPNEKIGRANALLTVGFMGGGFVIQSGIGYVLTLWPAGAGGHYPVQSYAVALAVPLALQSLSLGWFLWCRAGMRVAAPLPQP
jgi:predicted MFS family arabinose efflux permease